MVFDVSDILAVIHDIPDHYHYLTVDELRESLHRIAEEYPAAVKVDVVETSQSAKKDWVKP